MRVIKNIIYTAAILPSLVFAQSADVQELDLDSLLDSEVQLSSVMKRLQSARETAAAVYVLSGEEILKSGVTSIPQALTLVPGIQVRKIDNNTWAITLRATAGRYSSKLLVLVDGQSIYDSVHAGVNWEALNFPLYDIEKIEIVRGQGGLLWGSNATNGVVNIITKHSEDTRGLVAQVEAGSTAEFNPSVRYGSDIGELGSYRLYTFAKNTKTSNRLNNDLSPNDSSDIAGIGGRLDLNLSETLFMQVQGSFQDINIGSTIVMPDLTTNERTYSEEEDIRRSYNMMAKVEHYINDHSSQMYQLALGSSSYDSLYYEEEQKTLDADYQFNTQAGSFQWDFGLNYRLIDVSLGDTDYISTITDLDAIEQFGGFVQMQAELIPGELRFTLGDKLEHNSITGWEHQPISRLVWMPDAHHSLWASVSQGVRIPSLVETDASIRVSGVTVSDYIETGDSTIDDYRIQQYILGNSDIDAETSVSQEVGYRYAETKWTAELSLFNTKSRDVLAIEADLSPYSIDELSSAYVSDLYNGTSYLSQMLASSIVSQSLVSAGELRTYGGELIMGWQVMPQLKAELGYSYSRYDYDLPDGVYSAIGFDSSLEQWLLKMSASLNQDHSLFTLLRMERGEAYSTDDFFALDISWQWQVSQRIQLGITGNNLLYGEHLEYANTNELYTIPAYIEPSVTVRLKFEI